MPARPINARDCTFRVLPPWTSDAGREPACMRLCRQEAAQARAATKAGGCV